MRGTLGTQSTLYDNGFTDAVINLLEDEEEEEVFSSPLSNRKSMAVSASPAAAAALLLKAKKASYVRVIEEPASKGLRFRYECEGRSAGSIPGASSTNDRKTYPTIEVVGYKGRAVVVVSCVTCEPPYRPHPHNLVGKEGCKKGVCTLELNPENMTCSFPSLGIQCVKKKEIEESLNLRQQIRVDPFQTGFSHRDNPQSIDLNSVRLCFQVFLEGNEKGAFTFALKPVVSEPIYDKKARSDLTICRMTEYSACVTGGKEMLIFCDKVTKDDIQIRFFEEKDGHVFWEGFGDFQPSDVHKQYGICFRTPRYENLEIDRPVKVNMQLRRPSDGAVSESREFEFLPLDSGRGFWAAKRLKSNYNVFNNILSVDQGLRNNTQMAISLKPQEPDGMQSLKRKTRLTTEEPKVDKSPEPFRPESDVSMISSVTTEPQSVNEILSLAEEDEMALVLDNISVNTTLLQEPQTSASSPHSAKEVMGASIEEDTKVIKDSSPSPPSNTVMDIDFGLLYEDVMQCVYDDVDVKYDGVDFTRDPPVPPARKRVTSHIGAPPPVPVLSDDEEIKDKPLPDTPSKLKSIISSKFPGKRESPKKKKDAKKKSLSESTTSMNLNHSTEQRQSLFQRLFTRTKSQDKIPDDNNAILLDEEGNEIIQTVQPQTSTRSNDENSNVVDQDLTDLQKFMDSGDLSHLDNMVTEFANQYLPGTEISLDNAQESNGNLSTGLDNTPPFRNDNQISTTPKN